METQFSLHPCVNVSLRSASHSLSLPSTDETCNVFSLFSFSCPCVPTDTAAKLQAVKDKARQANDTAKAVLAQVKDLHQNLDGLKQNYDKLADSVAKTNAVVKDPAKNSKISFLAMIISFISSHRDSGLDSWVVEQEEALKLGALSFLVWVWELKFPPFQPPNLLALPGLLFQLFLSNQNSKLGILRVDMLFGMWMSQVFNPSV